MKFFAVTLFALVAVAYADDMTAETLRSESDVGLDAFKYVYETSNGINAKAEGVVKEIAGEHGIAQHGEFGWTSPEGEKILTSYVADENGYQPTGSHLPVAPAIPEAIARALEWIAAHPAPPQ